MNTIGISFVLCLGLLAGAVNAKDAASACATGNAQVKGCVSGKIKRGTPFKSGKKVKVVKHKNLTMRSNAIAELSVRKKTALRKKASIRKEIAIQKRFRATAANTLRAKSAATRNAQRKVSVKGSVKARAQRTIAVKGNRVASFKKKRNLKNTLVVSAQKNVETQTQLVAKARATLNAKAAITAEAKAKLTKEKKDLAKLSASGKFKISFSLNSKKKDAKKKVKNAEKKVRAAAAEEAKAKRAAAQAERKRKAAIAAQQRAEKEASAALAAQKKAEEQEAAAIAAQKQAEEQEAAAVAELQKKEAEEQAAQKAAAEAQAELDAKNEELKRIEEELKQIEAEAQQEREKQKQSEVTEVVIQPPPEEPSENAFGYEKPVWGCFEGKVMFIEKDSQKLPADYSSYDVESLVYACEWNIPERRFEAGFPEVKDKVEWFAIKYSGMFNLTQGGEYQFRINSDDGTKLFIDGELVVDNDGAHPPRSKKGSIQLAAGDHELVLEYFQGPRYLIALQVFVTPPNGTEELFSVRSE